MVGFYLALMSEAIASAVALSFRVAMSLLTVFTLDIAKFHKSSTTADGLQLIEGEFGVVHGSVLCEVWWRSPSDAHTIAVIATRFIDLAQRLL